MSVSGKTRLKIAFFSGVFTLGGAERFISNVLHHLDRAVFAPRLHLFQDQITYPVPEDVEVRIVGRKNSYLRTPWMARQIADYIDTHDLDVVWTPFNGMSMVVGESLRRTRSSPLWIAQVVDNPSFHDDLPHRLWAYRTLPRADRFLSNSARLAGHYANFYKFARNKMGVLHNPTDFDLIDAMARQEPSLPPSPGRRIISVGRLEPIKRYNLLIDAFARIRDKTNADLVVLGEGSQRRRLERQIQRLGLVDRIHLAGFHANPFAIMARSDLFVMSSDSEGLPNALIEAQGLGLAAVSTDCPFGPDEIIEQGRAGLLVPTGDSDALARAMLELVEDDARRADMAAAAASAARAKFAMAPIMRQVEDVILAQMERKRGAG